MRNYRNIFEQAVLKTEQHFQSSNQAFKFESGSQSSRTLLDHVLFSMKQNGFATDEELKGLKQVSLTLGRTFGNENLAGVDEDELVDSFRSHLTSEIEAYRNETAPWIKIEPII